MRRLIILTIFFVFLLTSNQAFAQQEEEVAILNNQIKAFNDRDIDLLVENIDENFEWFFITSDTMWVEVSGREQFRNGMESYFKSIPSVRSEISDLAIVGDRVSFKETVHWENKKGKFSQAALGVYQIKNNKILRAWYYAD
ncbi:nuclear transport factor 2 family protein [Fulvivirgaceae bacterium BMA10]|uniref:Nuclear transport factor 2 family protein n=1 Tax=Splendidivirga corallicola TaxID=3051826 RepID=A0ABT8KYR5_9BACT|nr:nuclear transport factor 2 family protein [Fulvivirgaceae bacterium BMA10]